MFKIAIVDKISIAERVFNIFEALDCGSTLAAVSPSRFSHGVTLLMKLNIESIIFAGVGSGHFSSSFTTQA